MAWLVMSMTDGLALKVGWEWYQPTTIIPAFSISSLTMTSLPGSISTSVEPCSRARKSSLVPVRGAAAQCDRAKTHMK